MVWPRHHHQPLGGGRFCTKQQSAQSFATTLSVVLSEFHVSRPVHSGSDGTRCWEDVWARLRTPPPQISPTRYKMMVTERFIKTIPLRDDREHRWTTPLDQENAHRTEEHVSGKIRPAVHVETNTPILTHSTGRENTREIEADTNTST